MTLDDVIKTAKKDTQKKKVLGVKRKITKLKKV